MRILFAGSPAIAVPALQVLSRMELDGKGVVLAGLLTNQDSKKGRGKNEEPTDVSAAASELDKERKGLPPIVQLKPEKLDAGARDDVAALAPELLVSFACGHFFGPRFLALFPLGGINIHPSLLPKYRGACPIPAAILGRDKEMGICIQRLASELDSGDILAMERFELSCRETTSSLSETVAGKAASLLENLLLNFDESLKNARPQNGEAVYCKEIKKEEGLIDWTLSALEIDAQIRAYTPWPLSFTSLGDKTLFILEGQPLAFPERQCDAPGTVLGTDNNYGLLVQTGDGILAVTRLQWQAKKALDWKAFCNGTRDFIGRKLG